MLDPTASNSTTLICHIAGIPHRKPDLSKLSVGDKVDLISEPTNAFDPNAIKVMHGTTMLGYVPKDKTHIARTLNLSSMTITEIDPSRKWTEVIIKSV